MRDNHKLNIEIERFIEQWDGTIKGYEVKNMYENGTPYEYICDKMEIDYEDWEDN